MLYHVSRNGQTYGPYTREDLERYVASGNILPTDLTRGEDRSEWAPIFEVLGLVPPVSQPSAGVAPVPQMYATIAPCPDPPNLHWALVLVIGLFTCGLFLLAWDIVQAVWMRRVNRRSHALFLYLAADVVNFGGTFARMMLIAGSLVHQQYVGLALPVGLITFTLIELARFDMRRDLQEHYNGPEPVGLMLGPIMTFFFGSLYFQYHMTRINDMKRMARYRAGVL
ncbi:MAG: DUF4339 domain-containing protein [Acidobacteriota bacterium]|nr:DUF4339 domain-containing protein [Acidobacteriota bacterium]